MIRYLVRMLLLIVAFTAGLQVLEAMDLGRAGSGLQITLYVAFLLALGYFTLAQVRIEQAA
jgi:hypothetical protein